MIIHLHICSSDEESDLDQDSKKILKRRKIQGRTEIVEEMFKELDDRKMQSMATSSKHKIIQRIGKAFSALLYLLLNYPID